MSAAPVVDTGRVWTFEDLRRLPQDADWRRYEIVDGSLVVSPGPGLRNEFASADIRAILASALPRELQVIGPMALDLAPSYRIPDLLVVPQRLRDSDSMLVRPADVVLVVEVVSSGSVTTDRITKPAEYAAAGIPAYRRVETDPVSLTAYTLPPHGTEIYIELGTWRAGEVARLERPFQIEIDLSVLTR